MNLTFALTMAFTAVIVADLFWYFLGRYRGGRILKLRCRISLEPDSCVRRTENLSCGTACVLCWSPNLSPV
jgi:membrane protein DedA with SNARE-associated domain